MKPSIVRSLWWLTGPTVGILLFAWVGWAGAGPGLSFWAAFTGLIFLVGVPVLQLALIHTTRLKGRYAAVSILALATATCCAVIAWVSGAFASW